MVDAVSMVKEYLDPAFRFRLPVVIVTVAVAAVKAAGVKGTILVKPLEYTTMSLIWLVSDPKGFEIPLKQKVIAEPEIAADGLNTTYLPYALYDPEVPVPQFPGFVPKK